MNYRPASWKASKCLHDSGSLSATYFKHLLQEVTSKFGFRSDFYQIPFAEKKTFRRRKSQLNLAESLQRFMDHLLRDYSFVWCYLDDIFVASRSTSVTVCSRPIFRETIYQPRQMRPGQERNGKTRLHGLFRGYQTPFAQDQSNGRLSKARDS